MRKKIFPYLFLLTLFVNMLNAQLTIRNNDYVFVQDGILYVHDNMNLQEAGSKLYLRNDAQLIQGLETSRNTGLGEISVYQNGTTHNYAYNYWCSPVGLPSVTAINNNFRVNLLQDVTGLTTSINANFTTYNGISSPLTIANYWIYTFENSNSSSDWNYKGETGEIAPGLGFTMKGTSGSLNNQLYDFRGKPNNGTIINSVSENVWTLIGNPYPSALDALDFIHDTDNHASITGTLYFWEQDLSVLSHDQADYVGGYATYTINATGTLETFIPATFDTYNSDGSLNTTGAASTSGKQVKRYIPIGQGFMVEGKSGTTGNVTTKNSHREYYKQSDPNSEFFRPTNPSNTGLIENSMVSLYSQLNQPYGEIPEDYKRFRLNIDFNETYTRQLVQTFHDTESTLGFDYGMESKSPSILSNDAFWLIENNEYVAQALPFNINMAIPLHLRIENEGMVRIRIFDIQNFENDQGIFIHDQEAGTYTNLRLLPFEIALNQGDYSSRFEIVFSNATLTNNDKFISKFSIIQNNSQQLLTIYNPSSIKIEKLYLYDILGKIVWQSNILKTQEYYSIKTNILSEGIYIIKIQSEDYKLFTKRIIVKNL